MYCTAEVLFSQKQIASRIKERRRAEEKVSGLKKRTSKSWVVYIKSLCRRRSNPCCGRAENPRDPMCVFGTHQTRYALSKFGKEKDIHSEWFNPRTLMSAVSLLENLRIVPKKKRQQKSDGPAEQHGIWQKVCTQFMKTWIKNRATFFSPSEDCSYAIHHDIRAKRVCRGFQGLNAHAEQEGFELSQNGNRTTTKATNDSHYSEWVSGH